MKTDYIQKRVYSRIHQLVPIPCVDVALFNGLSVLIVRREIEPLKGRNFFPGGRVRRGETLLQAAERKLKEEVSISDAYEYNQVGSLELIIEADPFGHGKGTHSITTLFQAKTQEWDFFLNSEHSHAEWITLEEIVRLASPIADEYLLRCVGFLKSRGL